MDLLTTRVNAASTGAAAANDCVLPAVVGKRNYVLGFMITGAGATATSTITVTIAGLVGGTQTYKVVIPAGVTVGLTPIAITFPMPIPATDNNVAVTLAVPSFGTGNLHAAAVLYGLLS